MTNVVPFPRKKSEPINTLEKSLTSKYQELQQRYNQLDQLEEAMDKLDDIVIKVEGQYDDLLEEYAARVGRGNIPIKFLNVTRERVVDFEFTPDEIA